MHDLAFVPHLEGFRVHPIRTDSELVELGVVATQPSAACPVCQQPTTRVHSQYERQVADLPWGGTRVLLRVRARRFRCAVAECPRRIFCERLPDLVAVYARQSNLLASLLRAVGFALGGRPARRLLVHLHLDTSRSTLLRLVRRAPEPPSSQTPTALGVDEWAHRRGRDYGLILVDLDRHRAIDLLRDAASATLASWLRAHPGVAVLSRDRGGPLARAARHAAPAALQVADRFHLLRNLGRVAERVARRHEPLVHRLSAPGPVGLPTTLLRPDRQASRERTRQALQAQVSAIQHSKASGASRASTARALGLNRKTVQKYWNVTEVRERRYTMRRASALSPYQRSLQERWRPGERNAMALWRAIRQQGYQGAYQNVARYLAALRRLADSQEPTGPIPGASLTVRHLVALALQRPHRRTSAERATLQQAKTLHPDLDQILELLEHFAALLRHRPVQDPAARLDAWEAQARALAMPEAEAFLTKLEQDRAAVEAALSSPYSQGPTVGQITRLKALKRSMFGRANSDLLRKRFLAA